MLINEESFDEEDKSNCVREGSKYTACRQQCRRFLDLADVCHNILLTIIEKVCPCCRLIAKRWQIAVFINIGFVIAFGIRCNFGAARVRMIRNYTDPTTHHVQLPPFQWDFRDLSLIEGAFFYGYLVTQVLGGFVATYVPANKLFGIAIGIVSFLNILIPAAARAGYGYVVFIEIVQGLVQGVIYPACHSIWSFWAPPLERSKLATTAFAGCYAGLFIGLPLSALMTGKVGWWSSFCLYGILGIVWTILWLILIFRSPAEHPTITQKEKTHIVNSLGTTVYVLPKINNMPWKAILRSGPVWAIIVANFCRSWTLYLLIMFQIVYFRSVLKLHITEGGFIASLPHLVMTIVVIFGGHLADFLLSRNILSTTTVRKVFNCGGFGMEAVFLLIVAFTTSPVGAVAALTAAVGFSGFAISGYIINHLDIAPRYASILMGFSNGFGSLPGVFCPLTTERLIAAYGRRGWKYVFILAAAIHATGVTIYAIFASGNKQSWADPIDETPMSTSDESSAKLVDSEYVNNYGATCSTEAHSSLRL